MSPPPPAQVRAAPLAGWAPACSAAGSAAHLDEDGAGASVLHVLHKGVLVLAQHVLVHLHGGRMKCACVHVVRMPCASSAPCVCAGSTCGGHRECMRRAAAPATMQSDMRAARRSRQAQMAPAPARAAHQARVAERLLAQLLHAVDGVAVGGVWGARKWSRRSGMSPACHSPCLTRPPGACPARALASLPLPWRQGAGRRGWAQRVVRALLACLTRRTPA